VGLPGSGKSTWAGARSDCMVVSTDAIRKELFGDESEQKNGAFVFEIAYARLAQAVALGHDVIFDATNVKRKSRAELFKRFPDVEHVAVFVNTPFPIMFGLFFIITIDLQLIAFIMSTLITNVKTAYASAFCFIIVAMVINFIFLNPFIYQTIYAEGVGVAANIYKTVLYLFCPYSFSKAYLEIASIASTKLNEESFMNTPGRPYEYSDLFTVHEGYMVLFKKKYVIPPTYQSFIWLIVDGVIYFIFIFYLDVVIESNRGKAKSPIFFIYDLLHLCGLCKKKEKN
jgi:hypothetical protein